MFRIEASSDGKTWDLLGKYKDLGAARVALEDACDDCKCRRNYLTTNFIRVVIGNHLDGFRVIREWRRLTQTLVIKYAAIREQVAKELPDLIVRHHERTSWTLYHVNTQTDEIVPFPGIEPMTKEVANARALELRIGLGRGSRETNGWTILARPISNKGANDGE